MSARSEPGNNNRIDLYRHLLGKIQEMDQASGAQGYIYHWDDPDAVWEEGDPAHSWDRIWLSPVIQELFWVIETMYGEDLQALEDLDAITDPVRAPESFLSLIAASFGYQLEEGLTPAKKRAVLLGLIDVLKRRGTRVSYRAFYRIIGITLLDVYPLFKKEINEANNDYNRSRYSTTEVVDESVGVLGVTSFVGVLAQPSIKPQSALFRIRPLGVSVTELVGAASVVIINGLTPITGDAYLLSSAGTPAAGTSDALVIGSIAEFDGTSWIEIVVGVAGVPPVDTRALASYQTALNGTVGLVDNTDDGSLLVWDGIVFAPSKTASVDGDEVYVFEQGSVDAGNEYSHTGITPSGSWDVSLVPLGAIYRDKPQSLPVNQNDTFVIGSIIGSPSDVQVLSNSSVNYATGEFRFNLASVAIGDVLVTYEHVDEEWPHFAARIDMEIRLNVAPDPVPPVDVALVEGLLTRLEEVRPIHVLLRTFALVVELADDVSPTATDAYGPVRHAWYEYEGRQNHFLLDAGMVGDDDILKLEEIGASHDVTLQLNDTQGHIVSILDHAVIVEQNGKIQHV